MRSLKKIDYNPVGLIWGEDSKINKNKIKKLNIINLQRWVSISSILKISFQTWLKTDNFDNQGRQKKSLQQIRDNLH